MYRIALVSREVFPFPPSAGLGAYVMATARVLAADAEVTVVTTDRHEELYEALRAESSPELPEGVRIAFAREPTESEAHGYFGTRQLWSARALAKLKELYPDGGPDIVEFPDYLGEGAVTVQARNTLDPALRNTLVCIRLYTTNEITDVLNGYLSFDRDMRVGYDLERYALANADRILWPGGDVLGTYTRFYGESLAPARLVRHPVLPTPRLERLETEPSEHARLLYVGRLERRKGVQNLRRALSGLEPEDWRITLVGGDTHTAPLGGSMLDQVRLATADDPHFEFRPRTSREGVLELLASSDLLLAPSLWECWPNIVLEALSQDVPVLATPVGGLLELVQREKSGWLTADRGEGAISSVLEQILERKPELRTLSASGAPRRHFEAMTDPDGVRETYAELARETRRPGRPRSSTPLVSVVIPYFMLDEHIRETVESVFSQTYPRLEVMVVNDGSFRQQDQQVLDDLASRYPLAFYTEQNSGLGRARNFGISQSRGKYILPLDPDDLIEPLYIERCIDVLERRPELAYVNCWSRYIDEEGQPFGPPSDGYRPFTNLGEALPDLNVAGGASAVIRRHVFDSGVWYSVDATSYEDWLFYQELAAKGFVGHTIPEQLFVYRVRLKSMFRQVAEPHHERLMAEMATHRREWEVQWTS